MKKYVALITVCFMLAGCIQGNNVKGEYDLKGVVIEVGNEEESLLIEDEKSGLIWISLPDIPKIEGLALGDEVVIWTTGEIRESYPAQADAIHIEVVENK